jgi:hypothetical protein
LRICEKHRERAIETLFSKKTGTEYDLCSICLDELEEILSGNPTKEEKSKQKVVIGRPKKIKD